MGDLSPFDVVDCGDADRGATAARGGDDVDDPESAASCVAAVPVGASGVAGTVSIGGSDGVAGSTEFCGVLFRRQRLKNPNMHVPANH
jgi:hypothetical protein